MTNSFKFFYWLFSIALPLRAVLATQFTFDLLDSAQECFFEEIQENTNCTLDYQVVSGGQLDVDVLIEKPNQKIIYQELRKEHDTVKFTAPETGEYMICFSNKFSTFTDKSIYISFVAGKRDAIVKRNENDPNSTYIEDAAELINNNLYEVISGQTQYRLQEAYGRRFAKDLNDRVMWWSLWQTVLILIIGAAQVLVVRKLFNDPTAKPTVILGYRTSIFR